MKDALKLMARYNKESNANMIECLRKASSSDLKKDVGIYYKSVIGTLEHSLGLDIMMFSGQFRTFCKTPASINDVKDIKASCDGDLEQFIKARKAVDEVILQVIDDLESLSKIETLSFPGVKFEKPRYQLIISVLEHATHHRGQVAAALDILGVDNDFAGMLGIN